MNGEAACVPAQRPLAAVGEHRYLEDSRSLSKGVLRSLFSGQEIISFLLGRWPIPSFTLLRGCVRARACTRTEEGLGDLVGGTQLFPLSLNPFLNP